MHYGSFTEPMQYSINMSLAGRIWMFSHWLGVWFFFFLLEMSIEDGGMYYAHHIIHGLFIDIWSTVEAFSWNTDAYVPN